MVTTLTAPPTPEELFGTLVEQGQLIEAVQLAAVRLGPRHAVWWGALCVWRAIDPADEVATAAVDAAVAWVLEPSEKNRRHAEAAGAAAGLKTPAGAVATAAFWSAGSISLPEQPAVAPPAGVAEQLAANAVQCAAGGRDDRLRQSLRIAAELLAGDNLPPAPVEAAP